MGQTWKSNWRAFSSWESSTPRCAAVVERVAREVQERLEDPAAVAPEDRDEAKGPELLVVRAEVAWVGQERAD